MAISKTIVKNIYGKDINFEKCYIKVDCVSGNKHSLSIIVKIFDETKQYLIDTKQYSFIPDLSSNSTNFIKQSYVHIKTLQDFEGYVDLLDEDQL